MRDGNDVERCWSRLTLTAIVTPFPLSNNDNHKTCKNLLAAFIMLLYLILRNLSNRYHYSLLHQWREWGQRREGTHRRRQGPAAGGPGMEGWHHSSPSEPTALEVQPHQVHCRLQPGLHRNHGQPPKAGCLKLVPQSSWVIQTGSSVALNACSWVAGLTVLLVEQ